MRNCIKKISKVLALTTMVNSFTFLPGPKAMVNEPEDIPQQQNDSVVVPASLDKRIRRRENSTLSITNQSTLQILKDFAPKEALDPQDVKGLPYPNTGVYLWAKGYDVKRYLGKGTYGTVWECSSGKSGSKAMKVLANRYGVPADKEIQAVQNLGEILKYDKTGKYLMPMHVAKPTDTSMTVIKSELANGDGRSLNIERLKKLTADSKLDLDAVIRDSIAAMKAVKILHDAGYSHNDIKPENFLSVSNWKGKIEKTEVITNANDIVAIVKGEDSPEEQVKKINEFLKKNPSFSAIKKIVEDQALPDDKKISRISKLVGAKKLYDQRLKLGDFGSMSKIETGLWVPGTYDCYKDRQKLDLTGEKQYDTAYVQDKAIIEKKDVYALGVTIVRLVGGDWFPCKESIEFLQKKSEGSLTDWIQLFDLYDDEAFSKLNKLLILLKKMLHTNYEARITLDQALAEIKEIKNIKNIKIYEGSRGLL